MVLWCSSEIIMETIVIFMETVSNTRECGPWEGFRRRINGLEIDLAVSLMLINIILYKEVNGKHWRGHVLVLICLPGLVLQSSCGGLVHDAFLALLCFLFLSFSISSAWLACPQASLSLTFLPPLSIHVLIVMHVKLAVFNLIKKMPQTGYTQK